MSERRAGWLKFNFSIDTESGEEKTPVVRHWFILREDGIVVHSGKKSQLDFVGEYIFLDHFNDRAVMNPDDPEGLILTADEPRKIKVYLSGDGISDWIQSFNAAIAFVKRKNGLGGDSDLSEGRRGFDSNDASVEMDSGSDAAPRLRNASVGTSSENLKAPDTPEIGRARSNTKSSKLQKLIAAGPGSPEIDSPGPNSAVGPSKDPKLVYHLSVRISEARGLPKEGIDGYCSLNVDASRRRTRSVPKTSNPLWTDEFNFEVLDPTTSKLLLCVWDDGGKSSQDRMVAKAEIALDNLSASAPEQWYPLLYGRREAYVSGGIHIRIDRTAEAKMGIISVSIVEAKNLVLFSKGSQEFYVRLEYGKQTIKTKTFSVKEKSKAMVQQDPEWNETFEVKAEPDADTFTFYVINKTNSNTCVGHGSLTRFIHYFDEKFLEKWLVLEPEVEEVNKERAKQRENSEKCGDVRVTLKLNKVVVYPLEYYEPLIKFLFEEEGKCCVEVLEKTTVGPELRNSISQTLVRIYEARNKAPSVLRTLITHEVDESADVETLFRANSIGSKAVDSYMKLVGYRYLQSVTMETIEELYSETKKSCEVDPMKLDKGDDPKKNFKFLQKVLSKLLARLYETVDECPSALRGIFHHIQKEVERKFPADANVKYTGISGFLFLRFICAAILGPKLFDLQSDHPAPIPLKNLTVVAKTLQRIANMAPTTPTLEGCLGELEKLIEAEKEKMRAFLNKISQPNDSLYVFDPAAVDLQHELSNLQEALEKELEMIVAAYADAPNTPVSSSAAQLLLVLEQMNDGRHEAILTKASREKRAQDPEAPLELTPKYVEILRKREEKAKQIQELQAEYDRQQALAAEKGENTELPKKKDDIKVVALPDEPVLEPPPGKHLKHKQTSFIGFKRVITGSTNELSPRDKDAKKKEADKAKEDKDKDKKDKDKKGDKMESPKDKDTGDKSAREKKSQEAKDKKDKAEPKDSKGDKEKEHKEKDNDKDAKDKDKDKDTDVKDKEKEKRPKLKKPSLSVSMSDSKNSSDGGPDSPTPSASPSPHRKRAPSDSHNSPKAKKGPKEKTKKRAESNESTTSREDDGGAESADVSNDASGEASSSE